MNDNDRQLIKSAQNGDATAFEKLIEPYMKLVFQIMLKVCGNKHNASMLAQKVFVSVFDCLMSGSFIGDIKLQILKSTIEVCRRVEAVNDECSIDKKSIALHVQP